MVRYLVSRLAVVIPVVLVVLLITFTLGYYAPGDPIMIIYGEDLYRLRPVDLARMRHNLGLDRPYWEQYLDYMGRTVRGDLGRSIASKVSVNRLLASSLPISLQMGLLAAVFPALLGIPLGVLAAPPAALMASPGCGCPGGVRVVRYLYRRCGRARWPLPPPG